MTNYLAYCRVSTKEQADKDNSLPAQKRIIQEYADRKNLKIVKWYSEAKSGYKGNREEFNKMLEHLKDPEIEGVIFHKLDRSSRNVGDFALLDKMVTQSKKKMIIIEGEFDTSRAAGRLAFRNFCNMAVWYSENLSEEVTTKMEELLLKGYYPAPAPIGYRPGKKGVDDDPKKKYLDEVAAPFVKESFNLFATGNYSINSLCEYMNGKGMINTAGGQVRPSAFHKLLRNTFYYGLISWGRKTNKKIRVYEGNHQPLISKKLFEKVQDILDGRTQKNTTKHCYTYAKMIRCECGHYLISEKHKNNIYLACQNKECKFTSIREDRLEDQIIAHLSKYELAEEFLAYSKEAITRLSSNMRVDNKDKRNSLNLELGKLDKQLEKLNRAVLEGFFDTEEGIEQKNKIIERKQTLRAELANFEDSSEHALWKLTADVINVFNYLPYQYKDLNPVIKIKLINLLFLNRELKGQKLYVKAIPAFEKMKNTNYLIQGRKLLLNQEPKGQRPLEKALPKMEKGLISSNYPHGGHGRT
jgi:site-specific DNA recombinase